LLGGLVFSGLILGGLVLSSLILCGLVGGSRSVVVRSLVSGGSPVGCLLLLSSSGSITRLLLRLLRLLSLLSLLSLRFFLGLCLFLCPSLFLCLSLSLSRIICIALPLSLARTGKLVDQVLNLSDSAFRATAVLLSLPTEEVVNTEYTIFVDLDLTLIEVGNSVVGTSNVRALELCQLDLS
jgi:hypothetical protein